MKRKSTFQPGWCLLFLAGCAQSPPQEIGPAVAKRSQAHAPTDLVVVSQVTTLPGTTGVDLGAPIQFFTPLVTKGSRFEVRVLGKIADRAKFVDETGPAVRSVAGEAGNQDPPTAGHYFILRPAEPLRRDHWYTLTIEEDASFHVLNDHPLPPSGPSRWQSHFFTGSAPRIMHLEGNLPADTEKTLEIVFSEPVDLSSVGWDHLLVQGGVSLIKASSRKDVVDRAQVELTRPLGWVAARALEARLGASARGLLRDVANGETVAGVPAPIQPVDWHRCHEGTSLCWDDSPPAALAPPSSRTAPRSQLARSP